MKNNNNKINIIIAFVVMLIGCGFTIQVFGLVNPAAIYCAELGYQNIIKEIEGGQQGFCQFPDGSAVDEWKFFIGEEGKEYNYCQKQGYETKIIFGEECQYASKCAVCVLEDGTETSVTKLMGLNLKSTLLPWDPENQIRDEAKEPVISETNYLPYFIGTIVLVIFLVAVFIVYKKIKNRNDYY